MTVQVLFTSQSSLSLNALRGICGDFEISISHAPSFESALEMVRSRVFDVFLFDVDGFSETGAYELCKKMRIIQTNRPILVCSLEKTDLRITEFFKTGVNDFISKPFSGAEIVGKIQMWFKLLQPDGEGELNFK